MSRKSSKRRNTPANQKRSKPKTQNQSTEVSKEIAEKLENNLEKIIDTNAISKEELEEVRNTDVDQSSEINYKSAQDLYHSALSVEKVLFKRKNELDRLKDELEKEKTKLEGEKSDYEKLKKTLNEKLDKYNAELTEINQLRVEGAWSSVIDKKLLDLYEEKLKEQEKVLTDKISKLNKTHTKYVTLLVDLETNRMQSENEFQSELIKEKGNLQAEYHEKVSSKSQELDNLSQELEEKSRLVQKQQRELEYNVEDFKDEKSFLKEKAKKKVEQEIEALKQQIKDLKERNQSLTNDLKSHENELRHLGDYKAVDIISELRKKETEIFELREKLNTSPDILKIDDLKRLQKEKADWQSKLREGNAQLNEYKTRYENQKLQIGEKEMLEFQKEELEQRVKLQHAALEELKEEVNELTRQTEDKITFISCTEMDTKYGSPAENVTNNSITKDWIKQVQQGIAQVTENKLYYDQNIIRAFVSGLAMSRFSILQGISGTGKTSLPKAFIKAIGGNYGVVEVQSGWKDRQDLIGYYNTFEKKYYEGKFLKLLYMAGTPKYQEKPFFIILDEMNLSHPEHYFADMLSLMEETNSEKQNLTISDKVKDIPKLMFELEEGGIGLRIPENVWFIGTANHDETTLQFAPKTYDRANILEMPININSFKTEPVDFSKISIPNNTLLNFTRKQKWNEGNESLKYLDGNFKTICYKFGIGWGNRLEKHIKLFIPVFIALNGNEANALDHIIASKILRSIKGRYDLQESTLKEMKNELEKQFKSQLGAEATKSLKIINDELRRLE